MISGQVTEAEHVAAHRLHRRRGVLVVRAVLQLAAAAAIAVFFSVSRKWGVLLSLGAVGGLAGELVVGRVFLPMRLRRLYAQVKGRTALTYSWDATKLSLSSRHGHADRTWTDFMQAKEDDKVLLLYFHDALFEIVPKRWFRTTGQVDDFRRCLDRVK